MPGTHPLRPVGTLCKGLLLLVLGFVACGCGIAQPSCNSMPGGMSCRLLSESNETSSTTIQIGTLNISVPSEIAVPSGNKLLGVLQAVGHQHYMYNGTAWVQYNATAWLSEGDESRLLSDANIKGVHFFLEEADSSGGRPSWRLGSSRVTATSLAAVSVDSDSITWNLLQASSYQLTGSGDADASLTTSWAKFVGEVSFVQRLDTQRGLPPAASPTQYTVGNTFASVYSAVYAFYTTSASPPL